MHEHEGLSPTHEMYLKVVYRLRQANEVARVRDMAKGLGVTPGTVSAVLKKLERAGLLVHDRYGAVRLTPAGERVAECVVRKFETIRVLLTDVLGLDAETAEVDACAMEHAVSPGAVSRMEYLLRLVHSGQINVQPMFRAAAARAKTTCTDCVSLGACQAVAGITVGRSNLERN
ncbi:MAG: metal-dependent transcriptional regulator [Planctomycetes bacterium]|nr:metal-dependent transcriptional regulator [Planctomycetota bacterium]